MLSSIFLKLLPLQQVFIYKTHIFATAALVLQYVSNQAYQQKLLRGLRSEDLPVLKY